MLPKISNFIILGQKLKKLGPRVETPCRKKYFFSNSDFPTIQKWSPTLTDHFWFFGWEVKFFAQISLSRDPLQGKNIFFRFQPCQVYRNDPQHSLIIFDFFGKIFFVHPGGYHGSGTRNEPFLLKNHFSRRFGPWGVRICKNLKIENFWFRSQLLLITFFSYSTP